ncbi:MAG: hypothetical protein H0W65_04580 [Sphingomonas sp.]|uniref:hypothetical protein n=1 Tax=Sphingomonas sp. TaxID=28214 RepID=UPI0017DD5A42|nr:hypothetical protein [Sphingomonas sp.]MBA3666980.1 hypothetical protein [Sphingomonas sp.]
MVEPVVSEAPRLDQLQMVTVETDAGGTVSASTVMTFEQSGDVVSARYRGGSIVDGYLIGRLSGLSLHFRYVQADTDGRLDAGVSDGMFEYAPNGRLRLVEHFT